MFDTVQIENAKVEEAKNATPPRYMRKLRILVAEAMNDIGCVTAVTNRPIDYFIIDNFAGRSLAIALPLTERWGRRLARKLEMKYGVLVTERAFYTSQYRKQPLTVLTCKIVEEEDER